MKGQKADEPITSFIMDMRLLCDEYDPKMDELEIVEKIKARVLRNFYPHLTYANPKTVDELHQTCILIEEGNKEAVGGSHVSAVYASKDIVCFKCSKKGISPKTATQRTRKRPTIEQGGRTANAQVSREITAPDHARRLA